MENQERFKQLQDEHNENVKKYRKLAMHYAKAYKEDTTNFDNYGKYLCYLYKGELYEQALKEINVVTLRKPDYDLPFTVWADVLFAQGKYETSLKLCEINIEKFGPNFERMETKMECLQMLGLWDKTIEHCEKILELFPGHSDTEIINNHIKFAKYLKKQKEAKKK
jgi:tetratricopeptide (TPR) repeat protein